jgi:hypothetical protein
MEEPAVPERQWTRRDLTGNDLDFLVDTVCPESSEPSAIKDILSRDKDFRDGFIRDERVFRRVMKDREILLKISPTLFFQVLLYKAVEDLEKKGYTMEREHAMTIPVFDSKEVVELMTDRAVLVYLARMLASFTRVESHTLYLRLGKRIKQRIRFNDMDIMSLMSLVEFADEEHRFGLYKRIADICLFLSGVFPGFLERDYRYPASGEVRPPMPGRPRMEPERYDEEGRRYYRLAAEHRAARDLDLSDVLHALHEHFKEAKKPLSFMAEHYLPALKTPVFPG